MIGKIEIRNRICLLFCLDTTIGFVRKNICISIVLCHVIDVLNHGKQQQKTDINTNPLSCGFFYNLFSLKVRLNNENTEAGTAFNPI